MVRRKLPGTEWSGSILNKRKNEWREVVSAASLFFVFEKKKLGTSHLLTSFNMSTIIKHRKNTFGIPNEIIQFDYGFFILL